MVQIMCLRDSDHRELKKRTINYQEYFQTKWEIRHRGASNPFSCILRGDCHEGAKSGVSHLRRVDLFENEATRAAFKTFIKHGGSSTDETSISALLRFDAVMTNSIESLAEFFTSPETGTKNAAQEGDIRGSDVLLSRTNKVGAVPQESPRKLKLMLPIAASNPLTFCFLF